MIGREWDTPASRRAKAQREVRVVGAWVWAVVIAILYIAHKIY